MQNHEPEHRKRANDHNSSAPLHPDVKAAYDYVDSVVHTADMHSGGPMWYGWALREAFLAGVSFAQKVVDTDRKSV